MSNATIGSHNIDKLAAAGITLETAARLMAQRTPPCRLAGPDESLIGTFANPVIVTQGKRVRMAIVQAARL